jgi:hypothetical protein
MTNLTTEPPPMPAAVREDLPVTEVRRGPTLHIVSATRGPGFPIDGPGPDKRSRLPRGARR